MSAHDKKMLDREAVRSVIQQWNANRLDLFALSEPDENLLFHGVMRFYFQDAGQKIATKCIRVASDATVSDVITTLVEKFRPDMRMLSVPNYALYEVHSNGEERRLNPDEKPLLVQLNWHIDDREGRFLLKNIDQKTTPIENNDLNFKRKLSKREKKEQKKKEKLAKLNSDIGGGGGVGGGGSIGQGDNENHVAERLYTELPETSFTRSISNPEAVMRRRRQQKLEKKLQQFRSRDGGPDTGGTLKIYGESLCQDVPYKTLLLSIRDCAQAVVREMLSKYGLDKADPLHYCLVQVNSDGTEYILDDDECPLSILMNHPTSRGSIMFHVRRRPADSQPRRRKKKPLGVANGANNIASEREGPMLVEVTHSGDGGRRIKLNSEPIEVGSANTNSLQLFGPSIQARHCLISLLEGVCTVTPLHADALTFVNGHHISQPTILHNGSVVMFGRVSSYRFIDSPSDGRYNLALSQSQLDSACLYESRSPTSPTSWNDDESGLSPILKSEFDTLHPSIASMNGNNNVAVPSEHSLSLNTDDKMRSTLDPHNRPKETDFIYDPDGNQENETKSISSNKSGGSNNPDNRVQKIPGASTENPQGGGQEPILPAVLEFPETHQENFLRQVIAELDVNAPNFKLAPVYTLYLCARYRASTHYRPELQPTERAHKLTIFLHHVANLIYSVIQDQYTDPRILAFWMANSSEFLHFLKSDRHISAFSVQAQEVLAESVQTAFRNLVNCFRVELSQTLNQFLSETIDHDSAAGLVLTVLGSAMALLRRCRVNAALTIQLFSQLFHYINVICFNMIVANSHMCTAEWGKVMTERLQLLELWAERQGLELAADCHLAKINQCAQFLQAPKSSVEEIQQLACSCFRLNSLQMAALLQQEQIPRNLVDTAIRMAESVADELTRADGREVRLEESPELHLALLLPDDGFSCDVVRGIPSGLVDFLNPLQASGMCRLTAQPTSVGMWTVYMHQFNTRSPSSMSNKLPQPEMQVIKLHKNSNGMGLSIVAAKGAGQERLGIYIKSVVPGGAADADGRLQAGDQLLRVDGQSLIGITQERAADYLVRTGPVVTLEVAKQGAIYHGLATLLQQPSPVIQRGNRRMSERDLNRMGADGKTPIGPLISNPHLPNSKSVPALHHNNAGNLPISNSKSRSTHSLANNNMINSNNEQGFYQNLSVYRAQNQSQPIPGERPPMSSHSTTNIHGGNLTTQGQQIQQQSLANTLPTPTISSITNNQQQQHHHSTILNRPASAYYNNNPNMINPNTNSINAGNTLMPSPNSIMSFNHNHNMSASSSNLNGNISSNQLQQMQPQSSLTMGNRSKSSQNFTRDVQGQQSLRMNQMLAPSMPNIAAAHNTNTLGPGGNNGIYPVTNISSSQSMQNVNMIPGQGNGGAGPDMHMHGAYPNPMHLMQSENQYISQSNDQQRFINNSSAAHIRGQGKLIEMGEMMARRHQRQEMGMHTADTQSIQHQPHNMSNLPPKPGMLHSPSMMQQSSPIKHLPPTAPKPQANRPQMSYPISQQQQQQQQQQLQLQQQQQHQNMIGHGKLEDTPPLPPTATHPLFKGSGPSSSSTNYVASSLDPPKVAYYPITSTAGQPQQQQTKNYVGGNPWEREEREKEHEVRREHVRQWRDQQIAELSAVGHRTPQQDEQLKTLVLERDFERRAQEMEEQEDDNETSYTKENVQEVIRLANQANTIQTPVTNFRQTDIRIASTTQNVVERDLPQAIEESTTPTTTSVAATTTMTDSQQSYQSYPIQQSQIVPTPTVQPKSILKNNRYDGTASTNIPSSPSKSQKSASFADDRHLHTEHSISQLSKDIGNVNLSNDHSPILDNGNRQSSTNANEQQLHQSSNAVPPPPPPERNSSYHVMSQQQQKLRNSSTMGLLTTSSDVLNSNQMPVNNNSNNNSSYLATNYKRSSLLSNNNVNNNTILPALQSQGQGQVQGHMHSPSVQNNLTHHQQQHQQQQQQLLSPSASTTQQMTNNTSYSMLRDNKRVSFHDEENNFIPSQNMMNEAYSQEQLDLDIIREDPNRFIMETTTMLTTPTTPEADGWNNTVQSTPGVIGAQEVYRDPRQRRLAEAQQKQNQQKIEAVPEKLSFKEKMKMFALESGEDQTPKDKLKISRAQRDIDAVH